MHERRNPSCGDGPESTCLSPRTHDARAASGGSGNAAAEEDVSKTVLRWKGELWHGHTRME
jgi:hypothetical protein